MLKPISALAVAIFLASTVCLSEASAFNWGYLPGTGTSLGYLGRSLLYGSGLYRGGYGAPGYLVNSLVWNGAYAVGQGFNTARARSAANNFYQNGQPVGNGFMMSNGVVDQIAPAKWQPAAQAPQSAPLAASTPPANMPVSEADFDPNFMPVPESVAFNGTSPILTPPPGAPVVGGVPNGNQPVASEFPPVAPELIKPTDKKKQPKVKKAKERRNKPSEAASVAPVAAAVAPQAGKSPFAGALIDHINRNFNGDLNQALNDKETAKFARAVGLIPEDQSVPALSADRAALVRKILSDPTDEPEHKVQAVRLLIKHQ